MINLTTQDADFVAQLARDEIENYQKSYDDTLKEMQDAIKVIEKLNSLHPDPEINKKFQELQNEYNEAKVNMDETLNDMKSKWIRVIELMMVGSNE